MEAGHKYAASTVLKTTGRYKQVTSKIHNLKRKKGGWRGRINN